MKPTYCNCGNYVSYGSTLVDNVAVCPVMAMDECVNCYDDFLNKDHNSLMLDQREKTLSERLIEYKKSKERKSNDRK